MPAEVGTVVIGTDPALTFDFGWLKGYPDYQGAAGNKAVIAQEWEFGLWSREIYGAPI